MRDDAPAPCCDTCLAYEALPSSHADQKGECRRYAPIPQTAERKAVWPLVAARAWCLQHRSREAPFALTFVPSDAPIEELRSDE